eukprot:3659030-Lingulodinium_polyedra.AAC.1
MPLGPMQWCPRQRTHLYWGFSSGTLNNSVDGFALPLSGSWLILPPLCVEWYLYLTPPARA